MASTPIHTFSLRDRSGQEHEYVLREHPTDPGLEVVDKLLQLGLGPILQMIFESVNLPANFNDMPPDQKADAWNSLRDRLDIGGIAKQTLEGLARSGGLRTLAPMLLTYTDRDGVPLKDRVNFATSYQANYGELLAACQKVVEYNGFFELLTISITS